MRKNKKQKSAATNKRTKMEQKGSQQVTTKLQSQHEKEENTNENRQKLDDISHNTALQVQIKHLSAFCFTQIHFNDNNASIANRAFKINFRLDDNSIE